MKHVLTFFLYENNTGMSVSPQKEMFSPFVAVDTSQSVKYDSES